MTMLRKLAVALVAASLIAGPVLAQSNTPATDTAPMTTGQPAQVDAKKTVAVKHVTKKHVAAKHLAKKHVAAKHITKKHVASKHVKKMHVSKHVKHIKPIKNVNRAKQPADKAS
jgi:hypothetical protein